MANFRSSDRGSRDRRDSRGGFRGRSSDSQFSRGRGSGGRSFGRGRDSGFGRKPLEMHDVTCDKCGKECQVPFKPSGDKPVLCSDCFRESEGSRGNNRNSSSGMSLEQFNKIEAKLDKIIKALKIDSE